MIRFNLIFLLSNLALAFYNVGTIWAMETDIFRSWKLIDNTANFRTIQNLHWKKLPYWIFTPVALAFMGSVILIWCHPDKSPAWAIWGSLLCQFVSHVLTSIFWGPWQSRLSKDPQGSQSPFLQKILRTHWIRTVLINLYAAILFVWTLIVIF